MPKTIDTNAAARRITMHVRGLVREVDALTRGLTKAAEQAAKNVKGGRAAGPARRRALTPKDRARLKLQGEYLGLMRHLPKKHHSRVKELRAKRGYPPAIKLARQLMA